MSLTRNHDRVAQNESTDRLVVRFMKCESAHGREASFIANEAIFCQALGHGHKLEPLVH